MENQTVAQKLEALVKLQSIDSKLDELKKLRGDLPDEVQDLGRNGGLPHPDEPFRSRFERIRGLHQEE